MTLAERRIEVVSTKPSQLGPINSNPYLERLVKEGYDIQDPDISPYVYLQFGGVDERRQVYLGYPVSSDPNVDTMQPQAFLTLGIWSPDDQRRGRIFWDTIKKTNNDFFKRAGGVHAVAADVVGVTTLPDARRQGISRALWERAIEELHPAVVVGTTNTLEEVVSRSRVLGSLGYRTYFGGSEITPGSEKRFSFSQRLFQTAYERAMEKQFYEGSGVGFSGTEILRPNLPNLSGFSDSIKDSFEGLIKAQKNGGQEKTAIGFLVSVRNDLA